MHLSANLRNADKCLLYPFSYICICFVTYENTFKLYNDIISFAYICIIVIISYDYKPYCIINEETVIGSKLGTS